MRDRKNRLKIPGPQRNDLAGGQVSDISERRIDITCPAPRRSTSASWLSTGARPSPCTQSKRYCRLRLVADTARQLLPQHARSVRHDAAEAPRPGTVDGFLARHRRQRDRERPRDPTKLSTCGDTRKDRGLGNSSGARSTPAAVVTMRCSAIRARTHGRGIGSTAGRQRGDGRRLVDRFDDAPARDVGQHRPAGVSQLARRRRTGTGPPPDTHRSRPRTQPGSDVRLAEFKAGQRRQRLRPRWGPQ